MTVADSTSRAQYATNGSTDTFTVPFYFLADGDLQVIYTDSDGIESTLVLTTDYSVSGAGNASGGSITTVSTYAADGYITILRDVDATQETEFTDGDPLPAASVNAALDKLTMLVQQALEQVSRALVYSPSDTTGSTLPAAASRANKQVLFDEDGVLNLSAPASGSAADLALLLLSTASASEGSGQIGYSSALSYPYGTPGYKLNRYRTVLDGLSSTKAADVVAGTAAQNCVTELQALIDAVSSTGGGTIFGLGYTVRCNSPLIIKDGVTLDMQGGKLYCALSGASDYGVNLRNYSRLLNADVEVSSSGSPGSQAGIHAPVLIGALAGDAGTVASPAAAEGVVGWVVANCKLWTNCDGKVGVQVSGGCANGLIENIEIPDSAYMFGAVHLDWNYLGTISSSDIATSRTNFDAGTAYTTHPHNIVVRNVKIGALSRTKSGTDTGSHGVRISGAYNVTVENVRAKQVTYALLRVTAGDVGGEFAPTAIKPLVLKGLKVRNIGAESTTDSWLAYCDSYADNVATAVSGSGYTSLMDPLHETDLEVVGAVGKGSGGASVTEGLNIRQIRGGRFLDIDAQGYAYGCLVDELVYGVDIHGRFHGNRGHGIYVHHATNKPQDVRILRGTHCYSNGQNGAFSNPAGIAIEGSIRCWVDGAILGHRTAASETTQSRGLRVISTAATGTVVENCNVLSVKSGGIAYSILSSTNYGYMRLFRNNEAASGITKYGGLDIVPIAMELGPDGVTRGVYLATEASLTADTTPTAGTWVQGDRIYYTDTDPLDYVGTVCTTGGTPGTWKRFGATA